MKDINKLYSEALAELASIDIRPERITDVLADKENVRYWGKCYHKAKTDTYRIRINKRILSDKTSDHAVKQVLIHEILHVCTGCTGHKGKWKVLANKVSRELGYNITRTENASAFNLENSDLGYKYVVVCKSCGTTYFRRKKNKLISHVERYRCGECDGFLEVYSYKEYLKKNKELKEEQLTLF